MGSEKFGFVLWVPEQRLCKTKETKNDNNTYALKGLCHAIFVHFQKLNGDFASIESQKKWFSFVFEDYLMALKLFPVVCCYRWQGWKLIET